MSGERRSARRRFMACLRTAEGFDLSFLRGSFPTPGRSLFPYRTSKFGRAFEGNLEHQVPLAFPVVPFAPLFGGFGFPY